MDNKYFILVCIFKGLYHDIEEPTHRKRSWCWERLKTGGDLGDRRWDGWMASSIQWHGFEQALEIAKDREVWSAAVHGAAKSWSWLGNLMLLKTWLQFLILQVTSGTTLSFIRNLKTPFPLIKIPSISCSSPFSRHCHKVIAHFKSFNFHNNHMN